MANVAIITSQATLITYAVSSADILYLCDPLYPLRRGMFSYATGAYTVDNGVVFPASGIPPGTGFWIRDYEEDILPQWFGITNDGKLIAQADLDNWMNSCKAFNKPIHFPPGTYCFPTNFQKDFGTFDVEITGVKGKSIITTYDTLNAGTMAASNFAIPAKVDLTKPRPVDGVYQVDITGPAAMVSPDFSAVAGAALDSYIQITGGTPSVISLLAVKTLGYVTELNVTVGAGVDPGIDGLYVVAKHPFLVTAYGGGFAHLDLNGGAGVTGYPTGGNPVLYLQGTMLQRLGGTWSRYFCGSLDGLGNVIKGGGFGTQGSMVVRDLIFDNIRFYLFSPFDVFSAALTGQTSDIFSISGCIFRNCERVLSSITYGGVGVPKSWFHSVYNAGGRYRFRNFIITDNEFSYIHECISWGPPPSLNTKFTGNNVHDCYTILTTFFLYMPTPVNTATYWLGKITQSVTNNSFIRIRPLNPGANSTTTIIRTCGNAIVNNNVYLDITQQAIYFSSTNSTFNSNSVVKFIEDYSDCPVMLVKVVDDQGMIEISGNTVVAPQSSFVGMEGFASFNITGNSFVGGTKGRIITLDTAEISTLKIYMVKNVTRFQTLAVNYDTVIPIVKNDFVYFSKRKNIWVKTSVQPGPSYVFSKVYNTAINAGKQYVIIEGNKIEIETITNLGNATAGTKFNLISVLNNVIQYSTTLHIGNKVTVEEYLCSGNYLRGGSLSVSSNDPFTNQVKTMIFENNSIAKGLGGIFLFAYKDLVFRNNDNFIDEDVTQSYYDDLGFFSAPSTYNPPQIYGVRLLGYTNSRITVEGNHFLTVHSKYMALFLDNPSNAEIKNNIFDLNTGVFTNTGLPNRNAVKIDSSGLIGILSFTDNIIYVEPGKSNRVLEFDTAAESSIISLTVVDNKIPIIPGLPATTTILATTKVVTTYYKGTNFYNAYTDSFAIPLPTIVNPI